MIDPTAERVALWRALHVLLDEPPHVLSDEIGLRLAAPPESWPDRPDMDPVFTRGLRTSVVARARYVEDVLLASGLTQYVLLGSGLDTFVQRRPDVAAGLRVFEVDRPGHQQWKRARLAELGYGAPELVEAEFEVTGWWQPLLAAGFDPSTPALITSIGVTMYLTEEAVAATVRQIAGLARGSTLLMTFQLPEDLVAEADRPVRRASVDGARAAGTPFISFFRPEQMVQLALDSGFAEAECVDTAELYFAGRPDGLRPSSGEVILAATV